MASSHLHVALGSLAHNNTARVTLVSRNKSATLAMRSKLSLKVSIGKHGRRNEVLGSLIHVRAVNMLICASFPTSPLYTVNSTSLRCAYLFAYVLDSAIAWITLFGGRMRKVPAAFGRGQKGVYCGLYSHI